MDYRIEWDGDPKPEYEDALRAEIDDFLGDPKGLITHTMMVDGAMPGERGPSVSAHWDEILGCVRAKYAPETRWVSLSELEGGK